MLLTGPIFKENVHPFSDVIDDITKSLISKFSVGLKSLLHQGLLEPEFYGDLVYKFKKIRGISRRKTSLSPPVIHY